MGSLDYYVIEFSFVSMHGYQKCKIFSQTNTKIWNLKIEEHLNRHLSKSDRKISHEGTFGEWSENNLTCNDLGS